ncbi:MAG: Ig-like domain-containing protein [Cyanobacteria bacterium P01_C01_bin.147]
MNLYYVSSEGVDSESRDGLSWETAWASLAYASDRVPAGENTIQLSSGTFIATETAMPNSGVTIVGNGSDGENATRIIASSDWELSSDPRNKAAGLSEYLIAIQNGENITIQDIALASTPEHRISGAVYVIASDNITIRDTKIRDFRWAGLHLELSDNLSIRNNYIENASTEKFNINNGLIRTRFIKDSDFQYNTVVSTEGQGYGYKGGGHENVRITHNIFNLDRGFAIESAHDNEFGVEIAYNYANQTISIPKGVQSAAPANRGYDYTFWVHHNLLTDSYAIEGPRNHLRLSHNYIRIDDTGGNVYTQHGGNNNGPVWIHNNVVENVDRGLVWMNQGLAENIYVYNNTVTLADAGNRAGAILSAPNRDGLNQSLNNWVVQNNIFIAPDSQPRQLYPDNGVSSKITATNNILTNVTNVPDGNYVDVVPGFVATGDRPYPFYTSAVAEGPMVDGGIDVGLPFLGTAPDIGAYEWGETTPFPVSVALLDIETLVNGVDADTADAATQVTAGELVTWTYEVTNIGTTTFAAADLTVMDELGLTPIWDATHDLNSDGLLQPEETWIYTATAPAEDLTADGIAFYRNVGTVLAPGGTQNTAGTLGPTVVADADASYYRNPLSTGLLFSVDSTAEVGGLAITDKDIVQYDGTDFSLFFDGSDVGLDSAAISAFDVISDTEILLSFKDPVSVNGVGAVDDSDVVKFTASSLGGDTTGTFSLYLDGSDIDLTRNGEDIDGLSLLLDGSILISTKGVVRTGSTNASDEDILQFIPTSLGEDTAGSWGFFLDGSDVGLNDKSEDINAFSLTSTGQLALSVDGAFQVTGQAGNNADIALFTPSSTGEMTTGSFEPALFFDGSEFGLAKNISGVDLQANAVGDNTNSVPNAQDDTAATSADAQLLIEVLLNDEDSDGDALSVVAVNDQPLLVGTPQALSSGALVSLNADGTLSYDPNGQFNDLALGDAVNDIFDYTVSDANGGESLATVVVSILGVEALPNTPPLANDDSFSTNENLLISGNVLVNNGNGPDNDPDGDNLAITAVNGAFDAINTTVILGSGALLTLTSDGQFTYNPNGQFEALAAGEQAIDTFDYSVSDGKGGMGTATVTIQVNGADEVTAPTRLEAENGIDIVTFRTEAIDQASGGEVLSLHKNGKNEVGSVAFEIQGAAGDYDILLGAFDENDGDAWFDFELEDAETSLTTSIGSITLSADLGSRSPDAQTMVHHLVASSIGLSSGDRIIVTGFEEGREHARIDYIELIPVI